MEVSELWDPCCTSCAQEVQESHSRLLCSMHGVDARFCFLARSTIDAMSLLTMLMNLEKKKDSTQKFDVSKALPSAFQEAEGQIHLHPHLSHTEPHRASTVGGSVSAE